jgi:hypothetical protein
MFFAFYHLHKLFKQNVALSIMYNIVKFGLPAIWCGTGFYRGCKSYEDDYKIKTKTISKAFGYGFCGLVAYINPLTLPIFINIEYKHLKNCLNKTKNS